MLSVIRVEPHIFSACQRDVAEQVACFHAEEPGNVGEQVFFRLGIAVLPVGDGAVHQAEDLITAGAGHTLLFPQDPEFGTEAHGIISFCFSWVD